MGITILGLVICTVAAAGFWALRQGFARSRIETEGLRSALETMMAKVEAALQAAGEKKTEERMESALEKLRGQNAALQREFSRGDVAWREASDQLKQAAEQLKKTADEARKSVEVSASQQSGLKSAIEALPGKTEAILRRFEERSAELLEENSLKAQEVLLQALARAPHAG